MAFKPQQAFDTSKTSSTEINATQARKLEQEKVKQEERFILESQETYLKGEMTVRDLIAPASFQINPTHLMLGETYVRTLFIIGYPRYINVGWFSPVLNLSFTLDVSMYFFPVQTPLILKQLQKRVGNIEAQLISDQEKGMPRDPIRETALRDIEGLRDSLTQGTEKFFQFALYITVYADTKEELDDKTDKIEQIMGSKLVMSKKVFFQSEQGFNSTLPLGNDELQIYFNMNSSPCASSFPFISAELTSDQGVLYGINRHNNSLIIFDRFEMQNANEVVFATSGAGKSYAIKLEVLRSLMLGTDVIVIDPEMEYKNLCDAVGGTYINISLASESKINPFDLPKPMSQEVKTGDIIRSAVITLKGLVRLMLGELSNTEDTLVDRALIETYAKRDITPETKLDQKVQIPIMQDFQEILEGMKGAENLGARLRKYTEGTFSGLLNNPTNVDVNNQLVVFSVRDLEDELRPIAIYNMVNYIWNVVRSTRKKRILVIDEAWWLMQSEDSARFVYALVKRCRKYYLGVTTITQDVNDFLRSPYGKAILTNSAIQILLKQSPAAVDLVQETFRLTEGEKFLLLEAAVGEGIFFAGAKHAAIKVVASYTEDQLITTNPEQLLAIEKAKAEFEETPEEKAESKVEGVEEIDIESGTENKIPE